MYQLSGSVVTNGNGECCTAAASLGGSVAEADWLGAKVCSHPVLYCSAFMVEVSAFMK